MSHFHQCSSKLKGRTRRPAPLLTVFRISPAFQPWNPHLPHSSDTKKLKKAACNQLFPLAAFEAA